MIHRAATLFRLAAAAMLAVTLGAATASAAVVNVFGDRFDLTVINNFYNTVPGTTSSIISGRLNTNDLTGVGLLWAVQPAQDYTAAELATMASYLANGGRIAFMGEHGTFAPSENDRITAAITALGGHMAIVNTILDSGFRDATVAGGQILANPLTAGVNTYNYAAFAPLTLGGAAQRLMLGSDLVSVMMGYENIGAGSIFLITDQNVWDNVGLASNDNATMFRNLLAANTGAPPVTPVPEPASLALFGTGLVGLMAMRRRRAG